MSEGFFEERGDTPTIEVRVFRHGELVRRELCELDGVTCEVDDLSVRHQQGEILEPEPAELREEDYPDPRELETRAPE